MSFESFNDDAWLERQMREVPLPPGLVARLKEIASGDDALLDEALREVSIPLSLVSRLHAIPQEVAIDDSLLDVAIPVSLAGKLKGIAAYSDDEIDSQLRHVDVPSGLLPRLRDLARRERLVGSWRRSPILQWAVAASLFLMVSSLYYGALASMIALAYPARQPQESVELDVEAPLELAFAVPEVTVELPVDDAFDAQEDWQTIPLLAIDSVEMLDADKPRSASQIQDILDTFSPYRRGFDPLFNVFLATHVISASPAVDVALPEITVFEHHRPAGMLPPTVKQFDLLSLIRTGTNPFVAPNADPQLKTSQVPLCSDTWSYDHLWRLLRKGELPNASEVFPEEFLAAVDYEFPPAAEPGLAIRTAAGPSPFGEPGTRMLQVGVVTSDPLATVRQVRYLTFAIDNSLSVARHGRLDAVQRALEAMIRRLGPRDRFSLVTFGERDEVLLENAGRENLDDALRALQAIRPVRTVDFAAGLRLASDTALGVQIDPRIKRSVVLFTDSAAGLSQQTFAQLVELTAAMHDHGANLEVIDLSGQDRVGHRLARLASVGGGTAVAAGDPASIRSALQRVLTGSDQIVARAARLKVRFNPQAVEAYRLIGHEPASVGGWIAGVPERDLHAGDTATALYELRLREGKATEIATIELTWHDPVSRKIVQRTQPVGRLQCASSLLESPLSLQRAALAAQLAEVLRGSPFAPTHWKSLAQLEEMSYRMLPAAVEEPSVQRLLAAARLALLVRSGRSLPNGDGPVEIGL